MEKVPFLELLPTYTELQSEFDDAYRRVMNSGWYLLGAETEAFEKEFATFTGSDHCITLGSGLDAIYFALLAFDIGRGDEVLVPAQTFIATWNAVAMTGAKPVPIDVCVSDGNMDPERIEAAITDKTRAIVPVDLFGIPCRMNSIAEIARQHGLVVVEDAAQAHGATRNGIQCGADSTVAAFSFYPGKNLGAFGDGGCVVTNSREIDQKIRILRNYGAKQKYYHEVLGFNSRLDELQAAFLRVKLAKLTEWNSRRKQLAQVYISKLSVIPALALAQVPKGYSSSWHLFPIFTEKRQVLQSYLEERQIKTLRHYPVPPAFSEAYNNLGHAPKEFPVAAMMAENELSLPIGPHHSAKEVEVVCDLIKEFFEIDC